LQNHPGVEFLAAAQICCVLLLKNMLYTDIDRSHSTIPPYWLIKSFHSTAHMHFCPQKMASEVPRPRSQGVYNGNNPRKKNFANCQPFPIREKTFGNIKLRVQLFCYCFTVTSAYIATCHTHFSNEGCHCRNLTKQYAPMQ